MVKTSLQYIIIMKRRVVLGQTIGVVAINKIEWKGRKRKEDCITLDISTHIENVCT